jgi:hypothetical protein
VCNGHAIQDSGQCCPARHIPATQLDRLVWEDLCQMLTHTDQITTALQRAQGGQWLPQELQARLTPPSYGPDTAATRAASGCLCRWGARIGRVPAQTARDQPPATEPSHPRAAPGDCRSTTPETAAAARGIEEFCTQVRQGLASATFEQRRVLVELLVDRVIVTDEDVEIRYVIPTSPNPSHQPFCQLRSDYLDCLPRRELLGQEAPGNPSPKNVEDAVHHLPNVDGTGDGLSGLGSGSKGSRTCHSWSVKACTEQSRRVTGIPLPFHTPPISFKTSPSSDNWLPLLRYHLIDKSIRSHTVGVWPEEDSN